LNLGNTKAILTKLLLAPIESYQNDILTILRFPSSKSSPILDGHGKGETFGGHFTDLLFLQSFGTRREVAHTAAKCILRSHTEYGYKISSVDGVHFLLGEICSIMVRDQIDGNLFGSFRVFAKNEFVDEIEGPIQWADVDEEQTLMAKLIHSFRSAEDNHNETFLVNIFFNS
jgi:vacuolar protein sorting-associated protein 35